MYPICYARFDCVGGQGGVIRPQRLVVQHGDRVHIDIRMTATMSQPYRGAACQTNDSFCG
jgi:hypothetical protein